MNQFIRMTLSLGAFALSAIVVSQEIAPFYSGSYNLLNLGSVPGVPPNYGGLVLKSGSQDRLLIGGAANGSAGIFYEIQVHRDVDGHIDGFIGFAEPRLIAPYNDGGVSYHSESGVLFYSMWPVNQLGMFKPGSASPDRVIDMASMGMSQSHASLYFLPPWIDAPSRRLKMCTWSGGDFYSANITPDGAGTFDVSGLQYETYLIGGPEGFLYVPPNSALFPNHSMLVCEYSLGLVTAYEVDSDGIPILGTRSEFVQQLSGAEGAFIDPVTGDFMFSTFGGFNQVVIVRGFATQAIVSGNVELQDYERDPSNQPVTFEIRDVGSTTPIETHTVTPDVDGNYSFAVNVNPGQYDMAAKGSHWLRRLESDITFTASGASGIDYSLVNGDCDPDNEVNIVDFGRFNVAFGTAVGDPGFDSQADLDGDEEVTIVDAGILASRFGQNGDD